jgi:glycosyltransferase involved in cell wall biosynthesis
MEHTIYNTDVPDYRTGPNKFGICMATYKRKNGKSPYYLSKSLNALLNQTATNWHLYIVGDKYEDNDEFLKCISIIPKDKITAVNLPSAPERENITNLMDLWRVGGCNAFNHAHQLALADNCDYILHNDDDDSFHIKKIQILNYVLSIYNNPSFIFHYSTYLHGNLPREKVITISKNNLQPRESGLIHTSFCVHKSFMVKFQYEGYIPNKINYTCGDVQFMSHIRKMLSENIENYTIFIPLMLCYHDQEQEVLR